MQPSSTYTTSFYGDRGKPWILQYYQDICLIRKYRLAAANHGNETPARPSAFFPASIATATAISREIAYITFPLFSATKFRWTSPTIGSVSVVVGELVVVILLCFYKLNPSDQWQWENIGYRTGFIAIAQLPLIFLLAGKNNIIGLFIGSSYERLNWLHRWASRILWMTATIHMGFWFTSWARYDYITVKFATDKFTQTGFAAWCVLTWIVFSSFATIRRWNYELFVVQHILSFAGFTAAVYLHVPSEVRVWVWIPIGLYVVDRCGRVFTLCYVNLAILHRKRNSNGFWACKATFEPLAPDATRIIINNPPIRWTAGQYVLLSCHAIAPFQSHPFTIASIPQDGRMEFLVKSKAGGTKRFFMHAGKRQLLPVASRDVRTAHQRSVIIEGPYGCMRPLRQFDGVIMFAGSTGGSFTVPLMRDIVSAWKTPRSDRSSPYLTSTLTGAVTRYIRFIWVIKSRQQYSWFSAQLAAALQDAEQLKREGNDIEIEMSIYITCDENLKGEHENILHAKSIDLPHDQSETISRTKMRILADEVFEDKVKEDTVTIYSTMSRSETRPPARTTCGPNGTCCCKISIEDEDTISSTAEPCQCNCSIEKSEVSQGDFQQAWFSNTSIQYTSPLSPKKPATNLIHSEIPVLSGRPQPRNLIRKTLEQALGETAVVVCGPPGLVDNVRQSVVALSDDRAVHKGSGAQGIYLHTEAFEY